MPHRAKAPFPRAVLDRSRLWREEWRREGEERRAVHGEEQTVMKESRKLPTPSRKVLVEYVRLLVNRKIKVKLSGGKY